MDFDGSSYLKPAALPAQKSLLDQVGQYQDIAAKKQQYDRGDIALSQDKLKQINDQFGLMNAELSTLANDPSITKQAATQRLTTFANTYGFKPEVTKHMLDELNAAPDVKSFAANALTRGMATQEKVNNLYGMPSFVGDNQTATPSMRSPMRNGGAPIPTGAPIQLQNAPGTDTVDNNPTLPNGQPNPNYGAKRLLGPSTQLPEGTQPAPGGFPSQYVPAQSKPTLPTIGGPTPVQTQRILPTDRAPMNLTGPGKQITGVDVETGPSNFNNRFAGSPGGPATSLPPMYEKGQAAYVQDQQTASGKMLAAKPAIQALPLMQTKGFLSGPLTDQFTKVVAGLKSTGLINIADNADPTAIRQEVAKKLYQYVSSSPVGQRSDAAQTLKEASSPNPNVQILPALMKLTKDAVALDRVEAMMPNAFKGNNYQDYIKHKGTFPQSIDEHALTLDLEPEEKSKELVDTMAKQLKSKNNRERNDAEKFFKTLRMAKDQGFYQ